VALVRTDVSEELSTSIMRVRRIGELGTALAVTSNRLLVTANVSRSPILLTLMMDAISSSETSVLTRATRRNISADSIYESGMQFEKIYIHYLVANTEYMGEI
jgi:hypothetical protein